MKILRKRFFLFVFTLCFFLGHTSSLSAAQNNQKNTPFSSVAPLVESEETTGALTLLSQLDKKKLTTTQETAGYLILQAYLNYTNEQYRNVAALPLQKGLASPLKDYFLFYYLSSLFQLKEYKKADTLLKKELKTLRRSPLFPSFQLLRLRILYERKGYKQSVRLAGKLLSRKRMKELSPAIRLLLVKTYNKLKKKKEARRHLAKLYIVSPASEEAQQAERELSRLLRPRSLSFSQQVKRINALISAGAPQKEIQKEIHRLAKNKKHKKGLHLYSMAQLYKRAGMRQEARKAFTAFVHEALKTKRKKREWSRQIQRSQYERVRWEWNYGKEKESIRITSWLEKEYPGGYWTEKSLYIVARLYENKDDFPKARNYYRKLLKRDKKNSETLWRLGWVSYLMKDFDEARIFLTNALRYTQSEPEKMQLLYWLGKTEYHLRERKKAEKTFNLLLSRYHNTYYGFLAEKEIQKAGFISSLPARKRKDKAGINPVEKPVIQLPPLNPSQQKQLQRINILNTIGLHRFAKEETTLLKKSFKSLKEDSLLLFISGLYQQSEGYYEAHQLLAVTLSARGIYHYDTLSPALRQALFPTYFFSTIKKNSAINGISPWLVYAIIKQESSFNPKARSRANAKGLMQLMEKTAKKTYRASKRLQKQFGKEGYKNLFDPEVNIAIGTTHLRELSNKLQGSHMKVIASYNAGVKPVKSWVKRFGRSTDEVFIERITYGETRNYVKRVLTNLRNYRSAAGGL